MARAAFHLALVYSLTFFSESAWSGDKDKIPNCWQGYRGLGAAAVSLSVLLAWSANHFIIVPRREFFALTGEEDGPMAGKPFPVAGAGGTFKHKKENRPPRLLLVAEDHYLPASKEVKKEREKEAHSGKYVLLEETSDKAPEPDDHRVIGIVDPFPDAVVGCLWAVKDNTYPETQDHPIQPVEKLAHFVSFLNNPEARALWKNEIRARIMADPALASSAKLWIEVGDKCTESDDPKANIERVAPYARQLVEQLDQYPPVMHKALEVLVAAAQKPPYKDDYPGDWTVAEKFLKSPDELSQTEKNRLVGYYDLNWRERSMMKNIAKGYIEAAKKGEDVEVILGAAHLPRGFTLLRESLDASGGHDLPMDSEFTYWAQEPGPRPEDKYLLDRRNEVMEKYKR
jgi:hypothetical protein